MVELLPCPFCGEKRIFLNEPTKSYSYGSINCPACLVTMPGEVPNQDELIGCWNARHAAQEPVLSGLEEETILMGFHNAPAPRCEVRTEDALADAIAVIRAEPCPFKDGLMADAWAEAWATFLNRLGDVDETNGLYAHSSAAQASGTWRTDMENAPKDRPFLAYWHLSDIYGVLESIDNKWIDQDGDEVLAFREWCLFDLPKSAPQFRTSQHAEKQPNGDTAGCGADTVSPVPSASRGTEA